VRLTYVVGTTLQTIEFDATIRELHESSVDVTSHKVERGSDISDHANHNPERVTFEACVSNTPLATPKTNMDGVTGSVQTKEYTVDAITRDANGKPTKTKRKFSAHVLQFSGPFDRRRNVYEELRAIQDSFTQVSAETTYLGGLVDYEEMLIRNLSVPREAGDGRDSAIVFTFDLVKVQIVDTKIVDTPAPTKSRKKRGAQGKKEVDGEKDKKLESVMSQARDKIVNALLNSSFFGGGG